MDTNHEAFPVVIPPVGEKAWVSATTVHMLETRKRLLAYTKSLRDEGAAFLGRQTGEDVDRLLWDVTEVARYGLMKSLPASRERAQETGRCGSERFLEALKEEYGLLEAALGGLCAADSENTVVFKNKEGTVVALKPLIISRYLAKGVGDELLKAHCSQEAPLAAEHLDLAPTATLYHYLESHEDTRELLAHFPPTAEGQPEGVTTQEELKRWGRAHGNGIAKDLVLTWLTDDGGTSSLGRAQFLHKLLHKREAFLQELRGNGYAYDRKKPIPEKIEVLGWLREAHPDLLERVTNQEELTGVGKSNTTTMVKSLWPCCDGTYECSVVSFTTRADAHGFALCPRCGRDATAFDRSLNNAVEDFLLGELPDHLPFLPEALRAALPAFALERGGKVDTSRREVDSLLTFGGKPCLGIEVDGATHYQKVHGTEEEGLFEKQRESDRQKALSFVRVGAVLVHVEWQAYASTLDEGRRTVRALVSLLRHFLLTRDYNTFPKGKASFVVFGEAPPGLLQASEESGVPLQEGEAYLQELREKLQVILPS